MIVGVSGPNGVYTNTRSRSNSRAPEARNGSNSSKAKTKAKDTGLRSRSSSRAQEAGNVSDSSKMKKAKDTKQSSKPSSASDDGELRVAKELGPVPTFRN